MPLDLEAIRKRCEAATKGPWAWREPEPLHVPGWCRWTLQSQTTRYERTSISLATLPLKVILLFEGYGASPANRDFIAHARTDLPDALDLIAEKDRELTAACARIAELEAEVGRLREAIQPFADLPTGPQQPHKVVLQANGDDGSSHWVTVGDFRRARAALEGKP